MPSQVNLKINNQNFFLDSELTIRAAIKKAGVPFEEDCLIIKGNLEEKQTLPRIIQLKTTRGKVDILFEENVIAKIFSENIVRFVGARVTWATQDVVAIGKTGINVAKDDISKNIHHFAKGDVFLFFAGFSPDTCFIGISKSKHEGTYGVFGEKAEHYNIGHVVRGGHIVTQLNRPDSVKEIVFPEEEKKIYLPLDKDELDKKITEQLEIFTYVEGSLINGIKGNLEHLFAIIKNNRFLVSKSTNGFIYASGISIPLHPICNIVRKKGAITLRNTGEDCGAAYIYRRDAPVSDEHNVVGEIVTNYPLITCARAGDKILLKIKPEPLELIGKTQKEAETICSNKNVHVNRKGEINDDAIIVMHEPMYSMDILSTGFVDTFGISAKELIHIHLSEEQAPKSIKYFREVTNTLYSQVGILKIAEMLPAFILFEHFQEAAFHVTSFDPENAPKIKVESGTLGITNSFRKLKGQIGIRLTQSERYGPTGEDFVGTNLIGTITENLNILLQKKKGDLVYFAQS